MDGTIVDSMGFWQQLGREFLVEKGITNHVEELLERVKPMTITESASFLVAELGLPETAQSIAEEMNAIMEAHYRTDIPLKPFVREYLSHLYESGVTMCVVSSTAAELMKACLFRLDILKYFAFLLSCEESGVGKHQPDVYLEAAKRLNQCARPEDIAVYEDAWYAANTAKQAGFYTIAVYDDSGSAEWEQLRALADETILDWSAAKDL